VHQFTIDGFRDSQKRPTERREGLTTIEMLDNAEGDVICAKRLFTLRVVKRQDDRIFAREFGTIVMT
jgi:hypothetical protein